MRIGEVSKKTGCDAQTIRYYERAGLLGRPSRTAANYRLYTEADVDRLSFIRHCRSLDMSLEEVKVLLRYLDTPEERCDTVNALIDQHIAQVVTRIAELKRLETQLKALRTRCNNPERAQDCGILEALSGEGVKTPDATLKRATCTRSSGVHL